MSSDVRFRLYEPSDREGLVALFRSVYGDEAVERKTSAWRYLDRPLRRSLISVAEADGRIVGTQPSYEILVKIGDEHVPGAVFLDVMTHPAYRGRGIFRGVVEHLRSQCHELGMAVLLTTPNKAAARGFGKLSAWRCLGELAPVVLPVTWSQLLGRRVVRSNPTVVANSGWKHREQSVGGKNHAVTGVDALDCSIEEVWRRFAGLALMMVVRDTDYVAWRFANRGARRYRLFLDRVGETCRGLAAAGEGKLLGRRVVFLTELLAPPSEQFTACRLLDAVVAHARATGAGAIVGYHVPGSAAERLLRRYGFWRVIRPFRPRPYTVWVATNLDERRAATILDLASWHMSMGDSDLA